MQGSVIMRSGATPEREDGNLEVAEMRSGAEFSPQESESEEEPKVVVETPEETVVETPKEVAVESSVEPKRSRKTKAK